MIELKLADLTENSTTTSSEEQKMCSLPGYANVDNAAMADKVADILLSPAGLGELRKGSAKHFYSDGSFNLIQLILYILNQTGPAHVFLTSYSISEDSVTVLRRKVDNGSILDIKFIIDSRVKSMSPKPFAVLADSFPGCYKCRAIHAKIALIYNDEWKVTVIGSQNATKNPKLERGIIHTDETIFDFDYKILTHEFELATT